MRGKSTRREFLQSNAALLACAGCALSGTDEKRGSAPRNNYLVFSKGRIAGLQIKNRLARSAAAEGASPEGRMTREGLAIYQNLASGGAGLIMTGHMVAISGGDAHQNQTHIDDDRYLDALKQITETVHKNGAGSRVFAQISHAGPNGIIDPIAPSEMPARAGGKKPRVLSTSEVVDLIAQFAASIHRAKSAGFDGVEIHGAHGYLLSSFLSPGTNKRSDEYGGTATGRAEIIRRIVAAAKEKVGRNYPIIIKVNCDDQGDNEAAFTGFAEIARELQKTGIDAIDISGTNPIRTGIDSAEKQSYFLPYAEHVTLKIPVILTGGNRSVESLEQIIKRGRVQFFGFARPLVREPDLPKRWLEGRGGPGAACISCNDCLQTMMKAPPTHCVRV
jgi:2,4-dienoyl-CoA reductase-like NADH-dependent reductase (Old Yellow Enzyme family)